MTRNSFGIQVLCPDCNAEMEAVEISPGVTMLIVRHDDTCPNLAAMEADRD